MTTASFSSAFLLTVRMRFLLPVLLLSALLLNACAGSERNDGLPDGPILLPTLDLIPIEEPQPDLSALLIGQQNGVNIHSFTDAEAAAGFLAPPDEHILFLSPANLTAGQQVQNIHGSPVFWNEVRYWGYEYSGNEEANRGAGKTGRELFDGRFWLSQGERNVTQALYGYLHTPGPNGAQMHMTGNKLYYLMVDGGAGVSGNPGLQGRPFVVCTGERSTCNTNIFGASSSAQASSADSSMSASSTAASDDSSPVVCAPPSLCTVALDGTTCVHMAIDCQSPSNPQSFVSPIPTGETCGTPTCAGTCVICPTAGSSSAASSVPAPGSSTPAVSCLTESITGLAGPGSMAKGDLDGDGDEDIAVLSNVLAGAGYQTVSILQNNQGSFEVLTEFTSPTPYRGLALGDFDGDGLPDLALAFNGGASMVIYINPGNGMFFPSQPILVSGQSGVFEEIATGDINGDGHLDMVVGGLNSGGQVFFGSDTLTFTMGPSLGQMGGNQYHPSLIDVNRDGHLDFVASPYGGTSGTALLVYINDGFGNFAAPQTYTHQGSNGYTNAVLFGDVNEDGFVDIVQIPNANQSVLGWINDGDGTFSKTILGPVRGRDAALADLNGDGHLDIISGNYMQPNYQLLLGNGNGTFTEAIWEIATIGRDMLTGDFDGDGALDFAQGMAENGNEIRLVKNIASCINRLFPPSSTASSSPSITATVCGDGVCQGGESASGCDPTTEAPNLCTGHIYCPEDCASAGGVVCGNGIQESGEVCDDGDTLAGGDCSANCQCDHWAVAETFMNTYCPDATFATNNQKLECYATIVEQWAKGDYTTPIPDTDCNGTSDLSDGVLLGPIVVDHYPEGV